jgi:HK97 gp10 family phage protein
MGVKAQVKAKWNADIITTEIEHEMMNRLEKAGNLVAASARQRVPIGTVTRPAYGGVPWTARKSGSLKKSIRVIRLSGDPNLDIRVYAGGVIVDGIDTYYAKWVEYGSVKTPPKVPHRPFLRPALRNCKSGIMTIMNGEQ